MDSASGWYIEEGGNPAIGGDAGRARLAAPESLFALSNGYVGVRGAAGEPATRETRGTYVNGFHERTPITYGEEAFGYPRWHETIVGVPDASAVRFTLDGMELGRDGGSVSATRRLDLRRGLLERTQPWRFPDGTRVEAASERFVSLARQNIAAFRFRFRTDRSGEARVESILDAGGSNPESDGDPRVGARFRERPFSVTVARLDGAESAVAIRTLNSGLSLACVALREATLTGGGTQVAPVTIAAKAGDTGAGPDRPLIAPAVFSAIMQAGDELRLDLFVSYRRDPACGTGEAHQADDGATLAERLLAQAREDVGKAAAAGFDALLEEHTDTLRRFWTAAGFELSGPPGLEAAVRFNMFHVFQAAGRDGRTNVPAKGLTGEGYEGHCFWDTEIYLLPLLGYTAPEIARALLENRHSMLERARLRARELAHRSGALFPWRTISGAETSAYFPAGTAQYHIDADVAYAAIRYARSSADAAFLRGPALDILVETARLWADAGHFGPDGTFRIDGVTGPDEYSAIVNNNAYTNLMAARNLREAATLVEDLRREEPDAYSAASTRLGLLPGETEAWMRAADAMFVPRDPARGLIAQDDSFLSRERWDLASTPKDKFPLLLNYHPLAIYRKQVLKQPDLLLAMMLLPGAFSLAEKKRNFDYYEALTTGDSSLSHCVMSVMAAETGRPEAAWDYFLRTVSMDLDDLHGNASHGVHIAAMGGSWLSLVYGFAGFRDDGGAWSFRPRLPRAIGRLAFSLALPGGTLRVELTAERASYFWNGTAPLTIRHETAPVVLAPGASSTFDLSPSLRAVIFDLDGVIADTATLHYRAWKRIADSLDLPFDETANEALKGRSRMESLDLILGPLAASMDAAGKAALAERKNAHYLELSGTLTPADILPGIAELIAALKASGIAVGLASASRNAGAVLERLGLSGAFDAVADPERALPKPDPELFLEVAGALGVRPRDCVGIEDAQAGVEAIRRADMRSVGIGGSLAGADLILASTSGLTVPVLEALFGS